MILRTPRTTLTDTPFPSTTLIRSPAPGEQRAEIHARSVIQITGFRGDTVGDTGSNNRGFHGRNTMANVISALSTGAKREKIHDAQLVTKVPQRAKDLDRKSTRLNSSH